MKLSLLLLLILFAGGCTTGYVMHIGVDHSQIVYDSGTDYLIADNGDIALKVNETIDPSIGNSKTIPKFLLLSHTAVDQKAREYKPREVSKHIINIRQIDPTPSGEILPPPFCDEKRPEGLPGYKHATMVNAVKSEKNKKIECVPYQLNSETYFICNHGPVRTKDFPGYLDRTNWWGYPFRLLVIPAFAVDIVTFPIQYQLYKRNFFGPS